MSLLNPKAVIAVLLISLMACIPQPEEDTSSQVSVAAGSTTETQPAAQNEQPYSRDAFFGELHLHSGYSFDAYALMGSRAEPDNAWRFAKGEAISYRGHEVRRNQPLDFMALTDHAEYLGASMLGLRDPNSAFANSKVGKLMQADPLGAALGKLLTVLAADEESVRLIDKVMSDAWAYQVELADQHNQPGTFTTFAAYEWTTMLDSKYNLHRNVIFRDRAPDRPYGATDSTRPEDLWSYLDAQRVLGIEGLAIPHNSNASGGLMFQLENDEGKPIDVAYAQQRMLNEPLVEVYQHKGQSETSPLLSPDDEFAHFERAEELLTSGPSKVAGSYARDALGRGIVTERRLGRNPFKLGFVGGSDFHNGQSDSRESAYAGVGLSSTAPGVNLPDRAFAEDILSAGDTEQASAKELISRKDRDLLRTPGRLNWSAAGLTGVWAEQNTRESIYAALRRRETFATSGSMLRLRFFGGWTYSSQLIKEPNWVQTAYRDGVPMGANLPEPGDNSRPQFLLEATKDPNGANLDRIQVIKILQEGDGYREKVFDVAWSGERKRDSVSGKIAAIQSTVNLETAEYNNSIGTPTLSAYWADPDFNSQSPAAYYVRVIEIPTPRWPTILAAAYGIALPNDVSPTIQERAISSPIWYSP